MLLKIFEKYPVFQNARNAVSGNLIAPNPFPRWVAPPRKKILATGLFISQIPGRVK